MISVKQRKRLLYFKQLKGKESFLKESVLREIIVSMERSISWINAESSRRGVTFILSFIFIVFHGMHIFMQRAHWKATVTFLKQIKEIWDLLLLSSLFSLKEKIKVKFAKSHFLWSWAMAAFSWLTDLESFMNSKQLKDKERFLKGGVWREINKLS